MNTFLATFAVNGTGSDPEPINYAVSMLDFIPVVQAANLHVFLIRTEKSQEQLVTLLTEYVDPDDYTCVVRHPEPRQIAEGLREALDWLEEDHLVP